MKTVKIIIENFATIVDCVILILGLYFAASEFIKLDRNKKTEIILKTLDSVILDFMSNAEIYWQNIPKSGSIKRAQVIKMIYEKYPVLSKIKDQDYIIKTIDEYIDRYKPLMDSIINNIPNSDVVNYITENLINPNNVEEVQYYDESQQNY